MSGGSAAIVMGLHSRRMNASITFSFRGSRMASLHYICEPGKLHAKVPQTQPSRLLMAQAMSLSHAFKTQLCSHAVIFLEESIPANLV